MKAVFEIPSVLLGLFTIPGTCELSLLTAGAILFRDSPPRASQLPGIFRSIAIVVPAHNEATVIERCIVSLSQCTRPEDVDVRIVVIADNCTDDTSDVASRVGAEVLVRTEPARMGKGFALRFAFESLLREGIDAVLIVDADSTVDANLLTETIRWLDSGADGTQARYLVLNSAETIRTRIMNLALMAFNVVRPRGRARWGLSAGIFGNGFALTRSTLEAVPYCSESIVEDLDYHLQLVRHGRRIAFIDASCVRAEMPAGGVPATSQRSRWDGGTLGLAVRTFPGLVRECCRGNFRLFEPLLQMLLLPLGIHVALLISLAAVPFDFTQWLAIGSLSIVAIHVATAIYVGGGGISEVIALAAAPWYIAWKLAVLPEILKSARRDTKWIRTHRVGEG
jgi:cellulose synthase/poly-beta-1,6-N-acetylglucosamine synthase-like glycosyltransferase